jgi:hypothetical protein
MDGTWVLGVCSALKKQLLPSILQINTLLAFIRKTIEILPNVLKISVENDNEITVVV